MRAYPGLKLHRLTFEEKVGREPGSTLWRVTCACGRSKVIRPHNVFAGRTRSCGCLLSETSKARQLRHGMSKSTTYRSWAAMLRRCKVNVNYINAGIRVCRRWLKFENFLADMGECPAGHTIERRYNKRGYYLANCRWATRAEQNRNTSHNIVLTYRGKTQCAAEWARELGVDPKTLRQRIYRGKPLREVLKPKTTVGKPVAYAGRTQLLTEWANEAGIALSTLSMRLKQGVPFGVAIGAES